MNEIIVAKSSGRRTRSEAICWSLALLLWFMAISFLPNPRPLAVPDWMVRLVRSPTGLSEPNSRLVASIIFRSIGLVFLGGFVSLSLSSLRPRWAVPLSGLSAVMLGLSSLRLNYGYFPNAMQLELGVVSSVIGALAGMALLRSRIAVGVLCALVVVFFFWRTSARISDDLDAAARTVGKQLLQNSSNIPSGDEGFVEVMEAAFAIADENSEDGDSVFANKSAILALGVILGKEAVAKVANRELDSSYAGEFASLRDRLTLQGRHDLARHFWVSAALVVLTDEARSRAVGIAKEMMDAGPGGSGFSFVDLMADFAGIRFAVGATKNEKTAGDFQSRIRQGLSSAEFCATFEGLPEGMPADQFQKDYGGLGGNETKRLIRDIEARLLKCAGLSVET